MKGKVPVGWGMRGRLSEGLPVEQRRNPGLRLLPLVEQATGRLSMVETKNTLLNRSSRLARTLTDLDFDSLRSFNQREN